MSENDSIATQILASSMKRATLPRILDWGPDRALAERLKRILAEPGSSLDQFEILSDERFSDDEAIFLATQTLFMESVEMVKFGIYIANLSMPQLKKDFPEIRTPLLAIKAAQDLVDLEPSDPMFPFICEKAQDYADAGVGAILRLDKRAKSICFVSIFSGVAEAATMMHRSEHVAHRIRCAAVSAQINSKDPVLRGSQMRAYLRNRAEERRAA